MAKEVLQDDLLNVEEGQTVEESDALKEYLRAIIYGLHEMSDLGYGRTISVAVAKDFAEKISPDGAAIFDRRLAEKNKNEQKRP